MIASLDSTYSIDGEVRVNDRTDEFGIQKFLKYDVDEIKARRQPAVWMRFHWGNYYHIGYMVASGLSDGGGVKEIVTYSLALKLNEGTTFQIIPDEDQVAVTGVTVTPATSSGAVQLSASIAPAGATDKSGTWKRSDTAKVTVDSNGLASRKATGTANVTFTTTDGAKVGTSAITVAA